jgi:hypothetical protein
VIASLDSLMRRVEERSRASGQSMDEAAVVVVEDLERAAAALNARTAPLVPGCGVLVAAAGLLLKAEPSSDVIAEFFLGLAVLFAVGGFSFLARALFIYSSTPAVVRSGLHPPPMTSLRRMTAWCASTPTRAAAAGWPGLAWPA